MGAVTPSQGRTAAAGRYNRDMSTVGRDTRVLCLLSMVAALSFAGCGTSGFRNVTPKEFDTILRARGVRELVVPFRVTEEMRIWLQEAVPPTQREDMRLTRLAEKLLPGGELDIAYERDANLTAAEVFEQQRANCLSFTLLFVGLAREVGVKAFFVQVRDIETYQREGDLVILSDHVAVGFGPVHSMRVIDFARGRARVPVDPRSLRRHGGSPVLLEPWSRGATRRRPGEGAQVARRGGTHRSEPGGSLGQPRCRPAADG